MSLALNKHKLYERNLGFQFYLKKGPKKYITKLYNIFLNILNIGGLSRVRQICKSLITRTQPNLTRYKNKNKKFITQPNPPTLKIDPTQQVGLGQVGFVGFVGSLHIGVSMFDLTCEHDTNFCRLGLSFSGFGS